MGGRPARPAATDLIRKSPTEKDLRDYRRILSSELPTRATGAPEALKAAANWITSTLGPTNIGLPVRTQELGLKPNAGRNILVELPGRRGSAEVIVVCTGYDGDHLGFDSGSGTAMMMTVANAFVGLQQRRAVVFAFLCHDEPPGGEKSGVEGLIDELRASGRRIRGVIDLRVVPTVSKETSAASRIKVHSESVRDTWGTDVIDALRARQPPMASIETMTQSRPPEPLSRTAWSRQPQQGVPWVLLVLSPGGPEDVESMLTLARSLEGMIQVLANQ